MSFYDHLKIIIFQNETQNYYGETKRRNVMLESSAKHEVLEDLSGSGIICGGMDR